ncbi:hypothetical protein Btru_062906 [Bulinus truncatus]|nr:hypothetical protein Btru_062906 [Bulinus truncatus]
MFFKKIFFLHLWTQISSNTLNTSTYCDFGEENNNATITLEWNKTPGNKSFLLLRMNASDVLYCKFSGDCVIITREYGDITSKRLKDESDRVKVFVMFSNVSRVHGGEWVLVGSELEWNVRHQNTCHLKIVARAKEVYCSHETIDLNFSELKCTSPKIYPEGLCRLYAAIYKTYRVVEIESNTITYSHESLSGDPVYFKSTCRFRLNNSVMISWGNNVTVTMFPSVSGSESDATFGTNVSLNAKKKGHGFMN